MATLDSDDLAAIAALFTAGTMDMALHRLVVANDTADPAFSVSNSTAGHALEISSAGGNALDLQGGQDGLLIAGGNAIATGVGIRCGGGPDGSGMVLYAGGGVAPGLDINAGAGGPAVRLLGPWSDPSPVVLVDNLPGSTGGVGGHGLEIRSAGTDGRDVALTGSGDLLGNLAGTASLDLTQALADVSTATVGGALNGAHATAWGKVVKDVAAKLLKVFSFGSTTVPAQVFDLDDGTNPTTRTPQ